MKTKIIFLLFALTIGVGTMFADKVQIGDLYYNLNDEDKTAELTYGPDKYSGNIVIPTSITYNDAIYTVTSIGHYAFGECSGLTSVTIPSSITSIGNRVFEACISLTSVTIPNSVTSIGGGAFYSCTGLTSVTIPNSVTNIGDGAFASTDGMISFVVDSENPSYFSVEGVLFSKDMTTLIQYPAGKPVSYYTIPNNVINIGNYAFYNSKNLSSITFPNSITDVGVWSFWGCVGITTPIFNSHVFAYLPTSYAGAYSIPNGIESIGGTAFCSCRDLTAITIPKSVTNIGEYAFRSCRALTSIVIPEAVKEIPHDAFGACVNLKTITLGSNISSIGDYAFESLDSLKVITCYAITPPEISDHAFCCGSTAGISRSTVYVPLESVDLYKAKQFQWTRFKEIVPIVASEVEVDNHIELSNTTENTVDVTWPSVTGAYTYELVIKDNDGNVACTLIFNSNGQLTKIAFSAPSRDGAPRQTQTAGFSFTVTGLYSGMSYDLTITAKNESGQELDKKNVTFHTESAQAIGDIHADIDKPVKILMDGQIYILRGEHVYDTEGKMVK